MKTAVIYARYSCDKQNETSIDGQLRVCNEYAERNDIIILDTYIDRATSGTNDNRPAFQRMLRDSDKQDWDYVLVYKLDRFSRNKYEMATHKKHLRDNGIKVLSAMENIPDTPEGIILESLLEGMAEYYSAELSQKINRGLRESRLKGFWTGGKPPYGYKSINKRLVIDEEQAEVVRYIFMRAASGAMIKEIHESIIEKGIMFNGHLMAKNTVNNILHSERYTGICHQNGELYDNIFPRIIDDDTFHIVKTKLAGNKHNGKGSALEQIFKGLLYCGYCKKPIVMDSGRGKCGGLKRYYTCSTRKRGGKCKADIHKKELLEGYLVSIVQKSFGTARNINAIADIILGIRQETVKNHSLLSTLNKEKTQTENALDNVMKAIEEGIRTPTTTRRLAELEAQLEMLNERILKEEARLAKQISKQDLVDYIKNAIKNGDKEMAFKLIDKIYIYDDKIEIHYKLKKYKDSDGKHQSLLLYTGNSKLPLYDLRLHGMRYADITLEVYYN